MPARTTSSLSLILATGLVLSLSACGDDSEDTATGSSTSSSTSFTGKAIKVMTLAPKDTAAINVPAHLDIAEAAGETINEAGGINGHEVQVITCNDGNDTNKAAACARQAVEEKVTAMIGGFSTNGATINPILSSAGIPWLAASGLSPNELADKNSYMLITGAPSFAGVAANAVQSGCKALSSVLYDTPTTGKAFDLINLGLTSVKAEPTIQVRVPTTTTDFSSVAKSAARADCALLGLPDDQTAAVAKAGQSLGLKTKYVLIGGSLNTGVLAAAPEAFEGAVSLSNFPVASNPVWDKAKEAAPDVDFSNSFYQNTWAGYQVLADVLADKTDVSAAGLTAALDSTTTADAGGLMSPVDFTKEFGVPGLNRVFNRNLVPLKAVDGEVTQDGDYQDVSPFFGQ